MRATMIPLRTAACLALLAVASPVGAAPSSLLLGALKARVQGKISFRRFLRANPEVAVHRRGLIGFKVAALKGSAVASVAVGGVLGLAAAVNDGFHGGNSFQSAGVAALITGGGSGVALWHLGNGVRRAANSGAVDYAHARGIAIAPESLALWSRGGIIVPQAK